MRPLRELHAELDRALCELAAARARHLELAGRATATAAMLRRLPGLAELAARIWFLEMLECELRFQIREAGGTPAASLSGRPGQADNETGAP